MWKLLLCINSIRCMTRNRCLFCPLIIKHQYSPLMTYSNEQAALKPWLSVASRFRVITSFRFSFERVYVLGVTMSDTISLLPAPVALITVTVFTEGILSSSTYFTSDFGHSIVGRCSSGKKEQCIGDCYIPTLSNISDLTR